MLPGVLYANAVIKVLLPAPLKYNQENLMFLIEQNQIYRLLPRSHERHQGSRLNSAG